MFYFMEEKRCYLNSIAVDYDLWATDMFYFMEEKRPPFGNGLR